MHYNSFPTPYTASFFVRCTWYSLKVRPLIVLFFPQSLYLLRTKNQHGHRVCWMSTGDGKNEEHTIHLHHPRRAPAHFLVLSNIEHTYQIVRIVVIYAYSRRAVFCTQHPSTASRSSSSTMFSNICHLVTNPCFCFISKIKMSFDEIPDLTADVFSFFYNIIYFEVSDKRNTRSIYE